MKLASELRRSFDGPTKRFRGTRNRCNDLWKLIHQRGMGLRYLSPNGYGNDLVDRGFSIVGRLVDDQNIPVANYAVCASATSAS